MAELPLYEYAFIRTDELEFSERVRYICRTECPMYDSTWACPPAVGTLEECRERIMRFDEGLLITTITEVSDIANRATDKLKDSVDDVKDASESEQK